MPFNALEYVRELSLAGLLEDQTGQPTEKHKPTNLLLNCTKEVEQALAPLFCQILSLIEAERKQTAAMQGRRSYALNADKHLPAIKSLVLNAVQIHQSDYQDLHLGISRNGNDYTKTSRYALRNISHRVMMSAFDCMVNNGLLEIHKKGFYDRNTGMGERTRYHGTQALFDAVADAAGTDPINLRTDYTLAARPVETIRLKDSKKHLKAYEETVFTEQARQRLAKINELFVGATLGLNLSEQDKKEMLKKVCQRCEEDQDSDFVALVNLTDVVLHRTFNENDFSKGGRFYGGWWQNIPQKYREAITINGKQTVELDFSNMHPTMLYAEKGITLGDFEPYNVLEGIHRSYGKTAFNALLNAQKLPTTVPSSFPSRIIAWRDFLGLVMRHNAPIADRFLTGYGLDLQFKDSEIAEAVMLHFADQGILCLPVHDSFIVDADYEPELRIMMSSLFQDRIGYPVKVK